MLYLLCIPCEFFWYNDLKILRYIQFSPLVLELTGLDDYYLILVLFTFVWPGIYEMEFFYKLLAKVYRVKGFTLEK